MLKIVLDFIPILKNNVPYLVIPVKAGIQEKRERKTICGLSNLQTCLLGFVLDCLLERFPLEQKERSNIYFADRVFLICLM